MSIQNLFQENDYHIFANEINNTTNRLNDIWLDNINGAPYNPNPAPFPSLIPNKFLRTTNNVSPSMFWGDVNAAELVHGGSLQILHTNLAGTASEWTSNLDVPQNLTVAGSSTFSSNVDCDQTLNVDGNLFANNDLNVQGDTNVQDIDVATSKITLNGNQGLNNQLMISDGSGVLSYQNLTPGVIQGSADYNTIMSFGGIAQWSPLKQVKRIFFGTSFLAQNINSVAGPVAATFDLFPFANIANSTTSALVVISQPSNTQFIIGTLAVYRIDINGFIDPASSGLGNSIVTLSLEIDGVEQQRSCVVCNGNYSFSGSLVSSISAGQVVRILFRRVVGTGSLNIFAAGSSLPNFSSTITISNVN